MSDSHSPKPEASSDEEPGLWSGPVSRYGRRALMLGAAAAGAGITVGLVAGARPADAADGQAVLLGQNGPNANTAASTTQINTTSGDGLQANTSGDSGSHGVLGTSTLGTGVQGQTEGNRQSGVSGIDTSPSGGHGTYGQSKKGVGAYGETLGTGGYGVYGHDASQDGASGVIGDSTKGIGVIGVSIDGDGVFGISENGIGVFAFGPSGVFALGTGTGYGVRATDSEADTKELSTPVFAQVANVKNASPAVNAWTGGTGNAVVATIDNTKSPSPAVLATTNGTGPAVLASHPDGTALQVDGIASFSRSGRATVAGTAGVPLQSVVVTGVPLGASSVVLATPQGHVTGVAVEGVVPDVTANTFTIYLTKPVKVSLAIAWFVLG